jgi:peroxiredoxin
MKFKLLLFGALWLGLSTVSFAQKSMPDVEVQDLEGKKVNLKDYVKEDKLTILSFWATWCKPCKSELDAINSLYEEWQSEYDVELVAVSIDDTRTSRKIIPMVAQKGWPYTILTDTNQNVQRALNFRTIPQTFLVDGNGKIIYSHSGYQPGAEYELEDKIKEARM